jgi:RecA-family ATPase
MEETQAKLLILDTVAHLFSGNENDRSNVTQFVNKLQEIAMRFDASVLLLAHPGKSETGLTSEFSGSTAWDGSARSRWALARPKSKDDNDYDNDQRVLRKAKANYAGIGDEIMLRWDHGAFLVEGLSSQRRDVQNETNEDERAFMESLATLRLQGRPASASPQSNRYAPKLMMELIEWQHVARSARRKRITDAMNRMFRDFRIMSTQERGPDRHLHWVIDRYAGPVFGAGCTH